MDKTPKVFQDIQEIICHYDSVTLEDMKGVRLMNRIDTKYLVSIVKIRELLTASAQDYCIQEVDGERNIAYHTIYYDTPDHQMYIAHQNGRKTREKNSDGSGT